MTKLTININESNERFPLHSHYENQHSPQPCGFELDIESGELSTYISGEIGNAVPTPVWHNRILRFPVSPYATAQEIIKLAQDKKELFQDILDDSEIVWVGNNYVGRLGDLATGFIEDWEVNCYGEVATKYIITVEEQMQYESIPQTMEELNSLVETLIGYDGDMGLYMEEPKKEDIEREVLDYILDYVLYQGEDVGKEIAQHIIALGIDVGAWDKELSDFANN